MDAIEQHRLIEAATELLDLIERALPAAIEHDPEHGVPDPDEAEVWERIVESAARTRAALGGS